MSNFIHIDKYNKLKLKLKDLKNRILDAESEVMDFKDYLKHRDETIDRLNKRLEQSKKDWHGLREQLIFVESELQEANNDNSNYDDVILALGNTISNLRAKLKRRNINDSLNKNYGLVNHSLENCNTIRPEVEAGPVLKKGES